MPTELPEASRTNAYPQAPHPHLAFLTRAQLAEELADLADPTDPTDPADPADGIEARAAAYETAFVRLATWEDQEAQALDGDGEARATALLQRTPEDEPDYAAAQALRTAQKHHDNGTAALARLSNPVTGPAVDEDTLRAGLAEAAYHFVQGHDDVLDAHLNLLAAVTDLFRPGGTMRLPADSVEQASGRPLDGDDGFLAWLLARPDFLSQPADADHAAAPDGDTASDPEPVGQPEVDAVPPVLDLTRTSDDPSAATTQLEPGPADDTAGDRADDTADEAAADASATDLAHAGESGPPPAEPEQLSWADRRAAMITDRAARLHRHHLTPAVRVRDEAFAVLPRVANRMQANIVGLERILGDEPGFTRAEVEYGGRIVRLLVVAMPLPDGVGAAIQIDLDNERPVVVIDPGQLDRPALRTALANGFAAALEPLPPDIAPGETAAVHTARTRQTSLVRSTQLALADLHHRSAEPHYASEVERLADSQVDAVNAAVHEISTYLRSWKRAALTVDHVVEMLASVFQALVTAQQAQLVAAAHRGVYPRDSANRTGAPRTAGGSPLLARFGTLDRAEPGSPADTMLQAAHDVLSRRLDLGVGAAPARTPSDAPAVDNVIRLDDGSRLATHRLTRLPDGTSHASTLDDTTHWLVHDEGLRAVAALLIDIHNGRLPSHADTENRLVAAVQLLALGRAFQAEIDHATPLLALAVGQVLFDEFWALRRRPTLPADTAWQALVRPQVDVDGIDSFARWLSNWLGSPPPPMPPAAPPPAPPASPPPPAATAPSPPAQSFADAARSAEPPPGPDYDALFADPTAGGFVPAGGTGPTPADQPQPTDPPTEQPAPPMQPVTAPTVDDPVERRRRLIQLDEAVAQGLRGLAAADGSIEAFDHLVDAARQWSVAIVGLPVDGGGPGEISRPPLANGADPSLQSPQTMAHLVAGHGPQVVRELVDVFRSGRLTDLRRPDDEFAQACQLLGVFAANFGSLQEVRPTGEYLHVITKAGHELLVGSWQTDDEPAGGAQTVRLGEHAGLDVVGVTLAEPTLLQEPVPTSWRDNAKPAVRNPTLRVLLIAMRLGAELAQLAVHRDLTHRARRLAEQAVAGAPVGDGVDVNLAAALTDVANDLHAIRADPQAVLWWSYLANAAHAVWLVLRTLPKNEQAVDAALLWHRVAHEAGLAYLALDTMRPGGTVTSLHGTGTALTVGTAAMAAMDRPRSRDWRAAAELVDRRVERLRRRLDATDQRAALAVLADVGDITSVARIFGPPYRDDDLVAAEQELRRHGDFGLRLAEQIADATQQLAQDPHSLPLRAQLLALAHARGQQLDAVERAAQRVGALGGSPDRVIGPANPAAPPPPSAPADERPTDVPASRLAAAEHARRRHAVGHAALLQDAARVLHDTAPENAIGAERLMLDAPARLEFELLVGDADRRQVLVTVAPPPRTGTLAHVSYGSATGNGRRTVIRLHPDLAPGSPDFAARFQDALYRVASRRDH